MWPSSSPPPAPPAPPAHLFNTPLSCLSFVRPLTVLGSIALLLFALDISRIVVFFSLIACTAASSSLSKSLSSSRPSFMASSSATSCSSSASSATSLASISGSTKSAMFWVWRRGMERVSLSFCQKSFIHSVILSFCHSVILSFCHSVKSLSFILTKVFLSFCQKARWLTFPSIISGIMSNL